MPPHRDPDRFLRLAPLTRHRVVAARQADDFMFAHFLGAVGAARDQIDILDAVRIDVAVQIALRGGLDHWSGLRVCCLGFSGPARIGLGLVILR